MESPASTAHREPQYWQFLSETDKATYLNLKREFTEASLRHNRNTRLETFDGALDAIRQFAERKDGHDWRRFLVCGVCWMDNAIAINTRQLRLLVSKCKSSINGCLQKMGYATSMSHSESWKLLFSYIPPLKDHFAELRQWTVRYKGVMPPIPILVPVEIPVLQPPVQETEQRPSCPLKFRGKMDRKPSGES
jgi:hypothetical protein